MANAASLYILCISLVALFTSIDALSSSETRENALIWYLEQQFSNNTKSKLNAPLLKNRRQTIKLNFFMETFYGLDERDMLKLSFWITVVWSDEQLDWRQTEWANISEVPLDTSRMWVPDISIWSCDDPACIDISLMNAKRGKVKKDGLITMAYKIVPKIACPVNTDFFPFDIQRCKIGVGSFISKKKDFELMIETIEYKNRAEVGEWRLLKIEKRNSCPDNPDAEVYPCTQLFVHVQRKSKFFVSFVFVPCLLISSIQVMVFITNRKIHRVGVGLAIIMAVTMSVLLSSQSAPKSMVNVPLMGVYLIIQMFLIIVFTVVGLVNLTRKEMEDETKGTTASPRSGASLPTSAPGATKSKPPLFSRRDALCLSVYVFLTFLNALTCMTFIPSGISINPIEK